MGDLNDMPHGEREASIAKLRERGIVSEHFDRLRTDPVYLGRVTDAFLAKPQETSPVLAWDTSSQVERWLRHLCEWDGLKLADQEIEAVLPARVVGFDRLVVMPKGFGANAQCARLAIRKKVWRSHNDLDSVVGSVRTTDRLYAVWCRNRIEADEENANRPASDFEQAQCLTLPERLGLEGIYTYETGGREHLDRHNRTLCAGSRARSGSVPHMYWAGGKLYVDAYWCGVAGRGPGLRVRSAVMVAA